MRTRPALVLAGVLAATGAALVPAGPALAAGPVSSAAPAVVSSSTPQYGPEWQPANADSDPNFQPGNADSDPNFQPANPDSDPNFQPGASFGSADLVDDTAARALTGLFKRLFG